MDLTREYFNHLERGYDSADLERSVATERFMASVFRPDIVCRDFQGLQAYMDQWEKYTTFHQELTFALKTLRLVETDADQRCAVTVYANGELNVTFTQDTLKFLYPTLWQEREMVETLVGSRGCLPIEMALHFDCQGRVFAFESRVNLVSTLLQVLHSPSAAIHALEASIMTADGHWQVRQDDEEAARRERLLPRPLL
ncbi:hypothetical protein PHMEG_0006502 [Phytophthora megakarya]|uniref:Bzip transcription factor n=1 Tax=Phytophthora megakarya TaxID=4795 RepID=A0A225WPL7_9STRA|nr:hypothetical protein PHMEG_0006502 [Phytophthora megakarya]